MQKSLSLLSFAFITLVSASVSTLSAQAPQLLNYQAVVRNTSGSEIGNTLVSLRFTIHDADSSGNVLYQETQSQTTNQFGLLSAQIGGGAVVSGSMAAVTWGSGPKYLQVEFDSSGGINFVNMGSSQLISVPYALYAANSAVGPTGPSGAPGDTGAMGPTGPSGPGTLNGTINYVAKFTPDGQSAGNSQLFDNGNAVGIGTTTPAAQLNVFGYSGTVIRADYLGVPDSVPAVMGFSNNGQGLAEMGVMGTYTNGFGAGVVGIGNGGQLFNNTNDYGVYGSSQGFGGYFDNGGSGIALHAQGPVQIVDGTQQLGYVLTSDANGQASWQAGPPHLSFKTTQSGTSVSCPTNGYTYVPFGTVIYDDGSNYNNSSNQFTAPTAGVYYFTCLVEFSTAGGFTSGYMQLGVYVNGTYNPLAETEPSVTASVWTSHGTTILKLNAGDTVQPYVYNPTNVALSNTGNASVSEFSCYQIY